MAGIWVRTEPAFSGLRQRLTRRSDSGLTARCATSAMAFPPRYRNCAFGRRAAGAISTISFAVASRDSKDRMSSSAERSAIRLFERSSVHNCRPDNADTSEILLSARSRKIVKGTPERDEASVIPLSERLSQPASMPASEEMSDMPLRERSRVRISPPLSGVASEISLSDRSIWSAEVSDRGDTSEISLPERSRVTSSERSDSGERSETALSPR